jgi:hypothetical protein
MLPPSNSFCSVMSRLTAITGASRGKEARNSLFSFGITIFNDIVCMIEERMMQRELKMLLMSQEKVRIIKSIGVAWINEQIGRAATPLASSPLATAHGNNRPSKRIQ